MSNINDGTISGNLEAEMVAELLKIMSIRLQILPENIRIEVGLAKHRALKSLWESEYFKLQNRHRLLIDELGSPSGAWFETSQGNAGHLENDTLDLIVSIFRELESDAVEELRHAFVISEHHSIQEERMGLVLQRTTDEAYLTRTITVNFLSSNG